MRLYIERCKTKFFDVLTGCFAAVTMAWLSASLCIAQTTPAYPDKPIHLIVPSPPGGGPDLVARIIGPKLTELLGQPIVIENRVGSNGYIAADVVLHAPADGYMLLMGMDSLFVINPHLYRKPPFDPMKDLMPIDSLVNNGMVLVVNPAVPVHDLAEFIAYARKADPALHYASGGNGSQHHLTMERLKARAGINLIHVPYKGGAPATTATVAGEVEAMMSGTSTAAQIKAGRLRALAVTSPGRSTVLPDVPAIAETFPGFEMVEWYGLFGQSTLPREVVDRLRAAVAQILALDSTREELRNGGGLQPWITTPAAFEQRIHQEYEQYGKLVKDVGARID